MSVIKVCVVSAKYVDSCTAVCGVYHKFLQLGSTGGTFPLENFWKLKNGYEYAAAVFYQPLVQDR